MDDDPLHTLRIQQFVEKVGLFLEQSGGARMAGRVLGWLMISDPPLQSAAQIAEALHASAGSISTASRILVQMGMVERVGVRGDRRTYYQVRPHAWSELMEEQSAGLRLARELFDEGLSLLPAAPAQRRERLQDAADFYAFMEAEFPMLLDKWHKRKETT